MKNITYILLLFSLSVFGQRTNNFNDSTNFARPVRFTVPPYIIQGAGNGKVLTSDVNGHATWQTFSASGVTQQALNDSIARLDSTIKNNSAIFPNGAKIIEDTAYVLSSADAGYELVAINANTHFIMPDPCPFSVGDIIGLSGDLDTTTFDLSSSVTDIELFTGQYSENGETVTLQCVDIGVGAEMLPLTAIKDDNGVLKTLNKYLYDQLNTIDQRISDTATQIRSEIPDVSNFITGSSTNTLTNKRITARVDSTASSATPAINTDNVDTYKLTAQAVDITSFTTNLSGTPTDDQILHIVIIGTATRAITWGSKFEASTVALPTTTVGTNRLDVYFIWNTATSKWRCGGVW